MVALPSTAVQAYAQVAKILAGEGAPAAGVAVAPTTDFSGMVREFLGQAVATGREAETKAVAHAGGENELIDVVTALSAAETTLETIVAVRDKVIAAYQEISRMPI